MLTVDHPPHGFWAPGATEVEIRGTARPGTAALSKLEVSGVEVPIGADGSFGTLLPLSGSADIFGLRLEDVDGGVRGLQGQDPRACGPIGRRRYPPLPRRAA